MQLQRDVAPVVLAFKVLPRCLDSGDAYAERKMKKRLLLNRKLTATFKRMPCLRILNPEVSYFQRHAFAYRPEHAWLNFFRSFEKWLTFFAAYCGRNADRLS